MSGSERTGDDPGVIGDSLVNRSPGIVANSPIFVSLESHKVAASSISLVAGYAMGSGSSPGPQ